MGMIEQIEHAGQQWLCRSSVLPLPRSEADRDALIAMGVTFGPPVDDLFVSVTLPEGWQVRPHEDHDMWSDLVDAFGRLKATIFYKAAPYNRRARITIRAPEATP